MDSDYSHDYVKFGLCALALTILPPNSMFFAVVLGNDNMRPNLANFGYTLTLSIEPVSQT